MGTVKPDTITPLPASYTYNNQGQLVCPLCPHIDFATEENVNKHLGYSYKIGPFRRRPLSACPYYLNLNNAVDLEARHYRKVQPATLLLQSIASLLFYFRFIPANSPFVPFRC